MKIITLRQVRHHWRIYFLLLPAVLFVATFSYYPAISAMKHAFYTWNGDDISQYTGLENFRRAFQDETLGKAFGIVMIFIVSNFFKMVPSIITAVMIHRMISERARYLYRVLFVIPMIIPGLVWLLIWKFFYDPNFGVLNAVLNFTGMMGVLQWLDVNMPLLAEYLTPYVNHDWSPVTWMGGVFATGMTGIIFLSFLGGLKGLKRGWLWWLVLLPSAIMLFGGPGDTNGMIRLGVIILASAGAAELIRNRWPLDGPTIIKWIGGTLIGVSFILVLTTLTWTEQTDSFQYGSPAWLGDENLALPAMIFWGFPWVGVVSVLLYLAGLGNIDQSVYEAADIDGCGTLRKFWNIELPLITTQVRLNLVLMIIGTLKGWGLVFIIFGDTGGPGGAVMLPGLYMFRKAFADLEAGYGCAIGLLLFFLILVLTLLNNKYVRVEK